MTKLKLILRRFKTLLLCWWYKLSFRTCNEKTAAFLSHLTILILLLLVMVGCGSVKYVPIENNTSVTVRDSIVKIHDTITVEVPKESITVMVQDTISVLSTSLSSSTAMITDGKLFHSLEQSGTIDKVIDTCYITRIEEKVTVQHYPVEVTKEVKYIPNWVSYSLICNIVLILAIGMMIYLKLK